MENLYEIAFQLILVAGDSRTESLQAIKRAREGKFQEVEEHIEKAQDALTNAHQIQTDMIQKEARGEKQEVNIIMVHAQDHLNMALITLDNAKEMNNLYKMIYELKQ